MTSVPAASFWFSQVWYRDSILRLAAQDPSREVSFDMASIQPSLRSKASGEGETVTQSPVRITPRNISLSSCD